MAAPIAQSLPPSLVQLPHDNTFKLSYDKVLEYPENLVYKTSYPGSLKDSITRLNDQDPTLFVKDNFKLPFRDFVSGANSIPDKRNIFGESDLKEFLGDRTGCTPPGRSITMKDPRCRFIFFQAEDSREPLNISKSMLLRVLTYHQVMSGFLDFLSVFGQRNEKNETRDLRYSGFREQITISGTMGCAVPILGRSGKQFQLCYNLRSVVCKSASKVALVDKEWSIRQAAFHHQFDIQEGTTLWIVAQGRKDIKDERVQKLTGENGRPEDRDFSTPTTCFRASLEVHLLFCHWSTENWRWYIEWLEEVIEEKTNRAIHERRGGDNEYIYSPRDVQSVQYYEDRTSEAIMVLEANTDIITSLRKFYQQLLRQKEFHLKSACKPDIIAFAHKLDDMIYDSRMHIARAKVLVQITADRKGLILQHLQSQATEKQSAATEEMERLTKSMNKIGMNAQKEAIAMRIITVVTLIFLPATFVSTFFSTDIIKYQNQPDDPADTAPYMGSFSALALNRWLQVSLPLSALTLGLGYLFYVQAKKHAKKKLAALGLLPLYEEAKKAGGPTRSEKFKSRAKQVKGSWLFKSCL